MGWFKDNIWQKFFTEHHRENDTYPNPSLGNKGISQRFMETFADYIDDQILPDINNLVDNVLSPRQMVDRLFPYREGEKGVDLVFDNTLAKRRQILQYFVRISQVKGTRRGYEVCFKLMAFDNLIIYTVDVIVYFDNPLPTAGCNACYEYDVILTGSLLILIPTIVDAFYNIIDYNEPVDCNVRYVIYNDNYVVRDFVTFFFDDWANFDFATSGRNPNLYLDNSRNPAFSASFIDSSGKLRLSGSDEQYYEYDDKYFGNLGNIFFRKPIPTAFTYFDASTPTNITTNSFTANWNAKAGAVKYFISVGRSRANDNDIIKERVVSSVELGSGVTSYSVTGLLNDTTYYYQIVAENAQGQRALSTVIGVLTLKSISAPTALAPNFQNAYAFIATWQRVAEATAYEIDVATNNAFSAGLETFQVRNINQFMVYRGAGTYYYRVRAKIDRHYQALFYPKPISISGNSNTITVTI